MSDKIKDSFEKIYVDDSEKEQILENIWTKKDVHSEAYDMRARNNIMKVAAAVAVVAVLGTGTTYAYKHVRQVKNGEEVISQLAQKNELAEKFGKKDQDVVVKESDGYKVTYLGYVSSDKIIDKEILQKFQQIPKAQTYIVTAIEQIDGKTDKLNDANFTTVPLIEGYIPWQFSGSRLGLAAEVFYVDGIAYYITTMNFDLDVFADSKIYMEVSENAGFGYDLGKDGSFERKNVKGLEILFEINTDKSKADKEKAQKIVTDTLFGENYDSEAIEDVSIPGDIQPTEEDYLEAINNSTLLVENDELGLDALGRPVYGYGGSAQNTGHKNYMMKTGKTDYMIDYSVAEHKLYIFALRYTDGKFYQNAYEYNGDCSKVEWMSSYFTAAWGPNFFEELY